MAIRIGGRGSLGTGGSRPKPQNSGLAARAAQRIEYAADTMIAQRQTAIAAQSVPILAWRKHSPGALPCTCSTVGEGFSATAFSPLSPSDTWAGTGVDTPARTGSNNGSALDDYESDVETENTNPFDIKAEPDFDPDFVGAQIEDPAARGSGWLNRVVENGPFESGQTVKCPICFGSSYTDTWRPYKAVRLLGDFADTTDWDTEGGRLNSDANPSVMHLTPGQTVTWKLFVPRAFYRTIRTVVWDGFTPLPVLPEIVDANGAVEANASQIDALRETGGEVVFRLTCPPERDLRFTHFEALILLDNYVGASLPQLDIPYDGDFADYNTTIEMELPVEVNLNEGDIVSERQHGRLWLASSVAKNRTAGGKVVDLTVQFRAVATTEVYVNMDVWRPLTTL